jgi:ABC-2 type transport system permease protein
MKESADAISWIIILIIIVLFFLIGNPDGSIMKVASFLPFTSCGAMYARVALGNVELWEILLSFGILVLSIIGAVILIVKVYGNTILQYGKSIN